MCFPKPIDVIKNLILENFSLISMVQEDPNLVLKVTKTLTISYYNGASE